MLDSHFVDSTFPLSWVGIPKLEAAMWKQELEATIVEAAEVEAAMWKQELEAASRWKQKWKQR